MASRQWMFDNDIPCYGMSAQALYDIRQRPRRQRQRIQELSVRVRALEKEVAALKNDKVIENLTDDEDLDLEDVSKPVRDDRNRHRKKGSP